MTNTASTEQLEILHKLVATKFTELLTDDPSPAVLQAAAKFLKDNLICVIPENEDALEKAANRFKDLNYDDDILEFPTAN